MDGTPLNHALQKEPLSLGIQPAALPLRLLGRTYKCSWAMLGNPRGQKASSPGVLPTGRQAEAPPGSALCGAGEVAAARARLHNEMLRGNGNLLAGVADDLVRFALGHDANSVVRADEDYLEAALG